MDIRQIKSIIGGLTSFIPGAYESLAYKKGTGGTNSGRYCYSVWLRHLVVAYRNGLSTKPGAVAELGPGDSIGVGLAALLSGTSEYFGLDVVQHTNATKNLEILDQLITLYENRADIPDEIEFPGIKPLLEAYDFPSLILTDQRLRNSMKPARIKKIREEILNLNSRINHQSGEIFIKYIVPWYDSKNLKKVKVDMVYSQAVLQDIDDLAYTYKTLYSWLKSGGIMSHQIDFSNHGKSMKWNAHWSYSDLRWKIIRGKRPYFLNRQPYSTHIDLLNKVGFEVVSSIKKKNDKGIRRNQLAPRFRHISDDDLTTQGAHILSIKK